MDLRRAHVEEIGTVHSSSSQMLVSSPTACVDMLGGLLRLAEEKHFLWEDEPSIVLPAPTPTQVVLRVLRWDTKAVGVVVYF